MLINDVRFFAALRARNSGVFGTSLSQQQAARLPQWQFDERL